MMVNVDGFKVTLQFSDRILDRTFQLLRSVCTTIAKEDESDLIMKFVNCPSYCIIAYAALILLVDMYSNERRLMCVYCVVTR